MNDITNNINDLYPSNSDNYSVLASIIDGAVDPASSTIIGNGLSNLSSQKNELGKMEQEGLCVMSFSQFFRVREQMVVHCFGHLVDFTADLIADIGIGGPLSVMVKSAKYQFRFINCPFFQNLEHIRYVFLLELQEFLIFHEQAADDFIRRTNHTAFVRGGVSEYDNALLLYLLPGAWRDE